MGLALVYVSWNRTSQRVRIPCDEMIQAYVKFLRRVELFGNAALSGKFHLKLNIGERPIANKYSDGKMKRTLKRE